MHSPMHWVTGHKLRIAAFYFIKEVYMVCLIYGDDYYGPFANLAEVIEWVNVNNLPLDFTLKPLLDQKVHTKQTAKVCTNPE